MTRHHYHSERSGKRARDTTDRRTKKKHKSKHSKFARDYNLLVGGRRTGIKASRPLGVITSLLSSLSDSLRDSCVLVTKLSLSLPFFYSSRSHSIFISHSRIQRTSNLSYL
jgi:hypothetical protein